MHCPLTQKNIHMKERNIQFQYFIYESPEELPDEDLALLTLARKTVSKAYAPYSGFRVGAAVLLEGGEMLAGTNYENAAYPLGACAERNVLAAAHAQHPDKAVLAIAIAVQNDKMEILEPAAPCGGCRQNILETERKNNHHIRIIMHGESGPVYVVEKGADLLPLAFDETYL